MRTLKIFGLTAPLIALANCAPAGTPATVASEAGSSNSITIATATLTGETGNRMGGVVLSRAGSSLSVSLTIDRLEPGERAFHLHTKGLCEGPDFTSAGGHLNPFEKSHGQLSTNGKHLGDLPNITISEAGSLTQTFALDGTADELLPLIFDEDGTAVMIHAGPDDYLSDPAGAAGPRIACGVLARTS